AQARRLRVPRTHVLADVAAEEPLPDGLATRVIDVAAMLDGEVGDAAARVEHVRRRERLRRTRVETRGARAAATRQRPVERERGGGENDPDEEQRAEPGREQVRVLPDPPEARAGGQIAL